MGDHKFNFPIEMCSIYRMATDMDGPDELSHTV